MTFDKIEALFNKNETLSIALSDDNSVYRSIIDAYNDVSQFWKWSPEEYLKMPQYADLKGKWVK